jgi:hypothetical protein
MVVKSGHQAKEWTRAVGEMKPPMRSDALASNREVPGSDHLERSLQFLWEKIRGGEGEEWNPMVVKSGHQAKEWTRAVGEMKPPMRSEGRSDRYGARSPAESL